MQSKSATVREFMSRKVVTFRPTDDVLDAMSELIQNKISGAPVVDDHGHLVGMLSEFDCLPLVLSASYHGVPGGPVSDLMVTDVKTVDADMSIVDLAQLFVQSRLRRYPVLKDNRVVGQISRRDVLRALLDLST